MGPRENISPIYRDTYETIYRGKESSVELTHDHFLPVSLSYHFREPADKLFHDILCVFLTLSHSRSEYA